MIKINDKISLLEYDDVVKKGDEINLSNKWFVIANDCYFGKARGFYTTKPIRRKKSKNRLG